MGRCVLWDWKYGNISSYCSARTVTWNALEFHIYTYIACLVK